VAIAYAEDVNLNWESGKLAEGLACYRRAEFFEAHEHWELVWLELEEPEKSFLQAVIQTTAAFHHFYAGNPIGAASLMRRAVRRMDACSKEFGGLDVERLRAELRAWLRALEAGVPFPERVPAIAPNGGAQGTEDEET
jgi:predicted metal-dependent hydrolase